MLINDAGIARLTELFDKVDDSYSSLWKMHVKSFKVENGELSYQTGFGTWEPLHSSRLKAFVHRILINPYYRHGHALPGFADDVEACRAIAKAQHRNLNLDVIRQALTHAFLRRHAPDALAGKDGFHVVIGDGFGTYSSLVLKREPESRVVFINLPHVLLSDMVNVRRCCPDLDVALVEDKESLQQAIANPKLRAIAICAKDTHLLSELPIGLAVNMVGMQEMNPPIIAAYFDAMRSSKGDKTTFYCCNREEKELPDGTVTRFREYPWRPDDVVLVDELCPWNQNYYATRPPFYRPYGGPIRHRLARLAKA